MSSSDWWHERKQNQQLEQLQEDLYAASSETSHLRSRLSQLQGSLEARVGKLAAAFDAFVELSDIRQDLIGFADAAEQRQYAGQVLAGIAAGTTLPPAPADVPGYWLPPAITAVQQLCGDTDATASLAEASRRDERRTAIFVSLALAALGRRGQVRADWLRTAFGTVAEDRSVTRLQRVLWETAARGGFGAGGADTLAELLTPAEVPPAKTSWADALAMPQLVSAPLKDPAVKDQAAAADQLGRVRAAVERITGDRSVLEPAASTLRAEDALESGTSKARAGAASDDTEDAAETEPDPLVQILRLVIAQGSEPERESLARVAELRAKLTDKVQPAQSIDDPAGALDELLATDLRDEEQVHLAAFALRLVAAGVLTGAEQMSERASAPAPKQVEARARTQEFVVGVDGPDASSLAAAETKLRAAGATSAGTGWTAGIVVAVIGVAGGVGLVFVHWIWLVVGLIVAGLGVRAALADRARRRNAQAELEQSVVELRAAAGEEAKRLADYAAGQPARAAAATDHLDAIRKTLPAT